MGLGLRILKKAVPCLLASSLLVSYMAGTDVLAAEEEYPVIYGDLPKEEAPVVVLLAEAEEYTVLPGDSLWKIAGKLLGDGKRYVELAEVNKETVINPDLIFPDMVLTIPKTGSIVRKEAKYGGAQMGDYSMDMPYGWTVGILESGDAFANFAMFGENARIACLIQDKEKETLESVRDWEQCKDLITGYVSKNYAKQVSDLYFEHYQIEDQGDVSGELYLYSYTWQISPDYPGLKQSVCVGLKLTDHIQAEFVGYGMDYDIHGAVRYVSATFEEHFDPADGEEFTVNGSNMQMVPETEWGLHGMFNSFAWVDEIFTSMLNKALGIEEEKSEKERLIEKMQPIPPM